MKRLLTLLIVSGLSMVTFQPALAHGQDDHGSDQRAAAQARREEAREQAQQRIAEIKENAEARKAEIKQAVCERRAEKMQAAMPRMATSATRVKTVIDTMYDRVQGFYESGQLTVANYDELVGNIEAAKAESEVAVSSIEEFEFTIDCENDDIGQQLDAYRLVVREARDGLKDYRKELVALISSMRAEAAEQKAASETEESESEESETSNETENETETETETESETEGTEQEATEGVENETQQ